MLRVGSWKGGVAGLLLSACIAAAEPAAVLMTDGMTDDELRQFRAAKEAELQRDFRPRFRLCFAGNSPHRFE